MIDLRPGAIREIRGQNGLASSLQRLSVFQHVTSAKRDRTSRLHFADSLVKQDGGPTGI